MLAGAGVWQPTSGVPNDAGIITELLQQHLIARGAGHGATEVTLYDDPGVHIFMDIDGHFFGTSDGGGGGIRPAAPAGSTTAPPTPHSHVYKPYHLLLRSDPAADHVQAHPHVPDQRDAIVTHGLELGSDVHVGYTQTPNGRMTAQGIS